MQITNSTKRRHNLDTYRFKQILLVVLTFLLCIILVPRMTMMQQILALGGILGAGVSFVLLRQFPLGLLALIPVSWLVPYGIGTGTNTSIHSGMIWLALLIGLWMVEMMGIVLRERRRPFIVSRSLLPLVLFLIVTFFAFLIGQLPWFSVEPAPMRAQLGGLAYTLLSAGAFLLMANQIRNLRWLKRITYLFLALGAVYILGRLMGEGGEFLVDLFLFGSTGSMFWTWLVALALGQAFFNRDLHRFWRWGLLGLVLATLYVGYFQTNGWKSGYLPPLVAVAAILVIGFRSWRLALFVALLSIVPGWYLIAEAVATEEYSYLTRVEAWLIILEMVRINPIFGFGPANYYFYTPLYPILGYRIQFNSHNQYLDILAQTGVLGLMTFFWFAWEVGRLGWRLRMQVPAGFAQAYVYGSIGGLIATLASGMLVDWFLPFVYNMGSMGLRSSILPWLFLGGLVSLEQILRRQSAAKCDVAEAV